MRTAAALLIRLLVATGLVVDAVVHLRLASGYQLAAPGGIGQGNLFRLESVIALIVAAWLVLRPSRAAHAAALVVSLSAVAAVVLYRYVDVPAIGPIPSMYEPIWFTEKTLSAIAEGAAAALAAVGLLLTPARGRARTGALGQESQE